MEELKLLINAMISENANWSTIDIIDFYLGTSLPNLSTSGSRAP
jgi:hypothetical protein